MRRSSRLSAKRAFGFLGWLALGAGLASAGFTLFDTRRGAARRAMLRDKSSSRLRRLGRATRGLVVDTGSRIRGGIHELGARLTEGKISDEILEDRVRAQIGRAVSHPAALRVKALDGCVEISGPILTHEVAGLIRTARAVRGVRDVVDRLDVRDEPGEPALQGAGSRQAD